MYMKRKLLGLMLCFASLFAIISACEGKLPSPGQDPSPGFRALYAAAENCSIQATLTADYGDRVTAFGVLYTYRREGDDTVEILSPPEVAGLQAVIGKDSSFLQYDGISLETGKLPGLGAAPVEALSGVMAALREGHQTAWGREKLRETPCVTMDFTSISGGTEIVRRLWLEEKTGMLLYAEVSAGGKRVLCIEIETFHMT